MNQANIVIAGNGKTSRANLEALMKDYFDAIKDPVIVYLYYVGKPSEGIIWAAQYCLDHETPVYTLGDPVDGVEHSMMPPSKAAMFLLWSDEDLETTTLVNWAIKMGYAVYDITSGLYPITVHTSTEITPSYPEAEGVPAPTLDEQEDKDEETSEEEIDEDDVADYIYQAIYQIADMFADAIVRKLTEMNNK